MANGSIDTFDDYSTGSFDFDYFNQIRSIVGVWQLMVCLVGTPANLLVLRCAWRLCRAKRATQLYQYFVLSMTAADFIFVAVVAPALFCQFYLRLKYTRPWCTTMYTLSHCSTVCSSLSLLCLNMDKFIAIFRPLHHSCIVTRRRVLAACGLCWLLALGWSAFFVFGPALTYKEPCALNVASFGYYLIFTMCFFVTPTLVAAVLGSFIAVIAYRNEKQQVELQYTSNGACGRRNTVFSAIGSLDGQHSSTTNVVASRARTFTFVFATTAWSVITYLPYRIMYPIYISGEFQAWHLPVGFAFFSMMAANPVGNPFITIFTQRRYRMLIAKMWRATRLRKMLRRLSKMCRDSEKRRVSGGTSSADTVGRSVPEDSDCVGN